MDNLATAGLVRCNERWKSDVFSVSKWLSVVQGAPQRLHRKNEEMKRAPAWNLLHCTVCPCKVVSAQALHARLGDGGDVYANAAQTFAIQHHNVVSVVRKVNACF